MPPITPFDGHANPSHDRLPWIALLIIAGITFAVGWMVFSATPSIAQNTPALTENPVQADQHP